MGGDSVPREPRFCGFRGARGWWWQGLGQGVRGDATGDAAGCTGARRNENCGSLQNKPNALPLPKLLARKQRGREGGDARQRGVGAGKDLGYRPRLVWCMRWPWRCLFLAGGSSLLPPSRSVTRFPKT